MTSATDAFFTDVPSASREDLTARTAVWQVSANQPKASFDTRIVIAAPTIAALRSLTASKSLLFRTLDGGGTPASPAISLALSRKVPSLTAENSGFTKKITRSKYSHDGFMTSTT